MGETQAHCHLRPPVPHGQKLGHLIHPVDEREAVTNGSLLEPWDTE